MDPLEDPVCFRISQDLCYCASPAEQQQYGKPEVSQSASIWDPSCETLKIPSALLDSRWLGLYNTLQGKYLPKSRWLSKPCLSSMEVVIDDFCAWNAVFIQHSLLLDSYFQDLSPGLISITPYPFLLDNNICLSFYVLVKATGWILQNLYWQVPSYIWISHVFERKSS